MSPVPVLKTGILEGDQISNQHHFEVDSLKKGKVGRNFVLAFGDQNPNSAIMMKKLALNLLKSADEKLKSFSNKHHHSNKSSEQQLTPKKTNTEQQTASPLTTSPIQPPTPTPSIESTKLETVADVHCSDQTFKEDITDPITNTPDVDNMAERRPQRAGRQDNRNNLTANLAIETKRRSRSEGRSKGRNSKNKNEEENTKERSGSYSKDSINQQNRHSLYNEPHSDEGGFPDIRTSSSESEESLQKKWIKNPNMVKQARKSDKRKSHGNNLENGLNGRPNYLDLQGNKENVDRGSQKGKYKRLEEMRKKRVDMTVTSDEELNSPEFRISRLRQRALQGAKLSSKLPDRLDDQDLQKIHMEKIANIQQNKGNESSSTSEQITLRPIGPGQGSFSAQLLRSQQDKQLVDSRLNQDFHGNSNNQMSNKTSHTQGPYRKIPKQETNFTNFYNQQPAEVTYYQGNPTQGSNGEFVWNFQNNPGTRKVGYDDKQESVTKTNLANKYTQNVAPVPKQYDKGKNKRKSHSDDSLDELIESNIQYLESEMESGKLKKISASQPRMFPTHQSDIYNKVEKRRSSSLDSTKSQSSFQNEVKLRLQIPSAKETQYDNRSIQSSQYDRLSHSTSESSTPPTGYTLPPTQEYIFQNTVPKVERKFQSATQSPYLARRTTELSNMEDMSKSDSQLNCGQFGMNYAKRGNIPNCFPVNNSYYYPAQVSSQQQQMPLIMSSSVPLVEGGMFSDVDYDIEVTDRIKKWEKFMKKKNTTSTSNESKSPVPLTTILESEGGIPEMWTGKPQPSVTVSSISVTVTKSVANQPQPHRQQAWAPVQFEPKVQSAETSSHRMFRVVQQPTMEQQKMPGIPFQVDNVPKQAKVLRRSSSKDSDGSQGHSEVLEESSTKMWPPVTKHIDVNDIKQARLSRFEEELTELQEIKTDSVKDLRKKFDSDASGNESTDITENVTPLISTPLLSTPLRQRRQLKLNNNANNITIQKPIRIEKISSSSVHPAQVMTRKDIANEPQQQDQNADVWSPKLESGQGPVSIERVKARTLQTIPFHEDPFWKQIEQMTSFDDLIAAQNATGINESFIVSNNPAFEFPQVSQNIASSHGSQIDYSCSSYAPTIITSTRPVQTASATVQPKPKVFHTPTIQPLKLAVAAKSSIEALDEVLDDIRSSLQKKNSQQSYVVESSASSSSVQSPSVPKNVIRNIPVEKMNPNIKTSKVGQSVSQKYFDRQQNLMSNQTKNKANTRQKSDFVYPNFKQEVYSQMNNQPSPLIKNQTHQNQQIQPQAYQNQQIRGQLRPDQQQINQSQILQQSAAPVGQKSSQPVWQGNRTHQFNQTLPDKNISNTGHFDYTQGNQQVPINLDITQFPYIINGNYQLDPSVLKEKLMNTGLAFDQQSTETDDSLSQTSAASVNYLETERQFDQSIEQLQNLARDVEDKLSQIKCKIVDADENRLDAILTALRKFAPSEPVRTPPNIHTKEEQDRQRAKLNEALFELDKIYYGLHLDDPKVQDDTQRPVLMTQSQTLPSHGRNVTISSPQIRRNKSDTGLRHYQEETVAQVEQQTQREFEDITKSFETLLDEVSKDDTPISSKPSRHAAEIETTIESFLDEFRKSSDDKVHQPKNMSEKFQSKLKDAKMAAKANTCRDVQKSKVFTVSSGSFSALVGVKNKKNENSNQNYNSNVKQANTMTKYKKPAEVKSSVTSKPKVISSTAKIKLVSPVREIKVIKTSGSESEDISSDNHMIQKAKRNINLQHRKSMPACMIRRSVETQTMEPSSPVAVIRRQFQDQDRQSREGSVSSESSAESKKARRKTISKGIALLMEFYSSSEDDSAHKHSLSAPDLRFVGCEKMTKSPSDNEKFKSKSPHLKQKHSSKSKKRSSYYKFDNVDDKVDDLYVTSTTSDDNVPPQHGSKPPRHPKRKQSATSPEVVEDTNKESNSKSGDKQSNPSDSFKYKRYDTDDNIVRRRKHDHEEKERPHSFHELLAAFETNDINLKTLRKCSSADAMVQETTVLNKSFHSDPDLRKDSTESSGAKLELEIKLKDTAV